MALKLAVIADNGLVQRFALEALDAVTGTDEIAVFSCTNTRLRKRWLRHAAYYALNLFTVRNRLTRYVPLTSGRKKIASETSFASDYDGAWQVLPDDIVKALNEGGFDVVLKFGMGLLRVPPADALPVPILSYHHGDPDFYRGRPAGFWEMAESRPVMGQVVQVVGNRLDAGKVVATAETKVFPWSYRATLLESYRHSPSLINTAIRNAISGTHLPKESMGRNCRLPPNLDVARFVARTTGRSARRLFYGALIEKKWRVSTTDVGTGLEDILAGSEFPNPSGWREIPVSQGYTFYADPFFHGDSAILVEALDARSGLGEIVQVDGDHHRPVITADGHVSYPSTCRIDGRQIILPETASWSTPRVYVTDGDGVRLLNTLKIGGGVWVTDPTLFGHRGRLYLFGNDRRLGSNVLNIWTAASLEDEFVAHPGCPIRISPEGARMGGAIIDHGDRLFRLGQDFSRGYGDGLMVFEIETLTREAYSERLVGRIRFTDRRGPHTLNVRGDQMVFDWYHDRISPFAGFRRLGALVRRQFARRRPTATQ